MTYEPLAYLNLKWLQKVLLRFSFSSGMSCCLFEGRLVKFMNSQESGKNPALTETEWQQGGTAFLRSACV